MIDDVGSAKQYICSRFERSQAAPACASPSHRKLVVRRRMWWMSFQLAWVDGNLSRKAESQRDKARHSFSGEHHIDLIMVVEYFVQSDYKATFRIVYFWYGGTLLLSANIDGRQVQDKPNTNTSVTRSLWCISVVGSSIAAPVWPPAYHCSRRALEKLGAASRTVTLQPGFAIAPLPCSIGLQPVTASTIRRFSQIIAAQYHLVDAPEVFTTLCSDSGRVRCIAAERRFAHDSAGDRGMLGPLRLHTAIQRIEVDDEEYKGSEYKGMPPTIPITVFQAVADVLSLCLFCAFALRKNKVGVPESGETTPHLGTIYSGDQVVLVHLRCSSPRPCADSAARQSRCGRSVQHCGHVSVAQRCAVAMSRSLGAVLWPYRSPPRVVVLMVVVATMVMKMLTVFLPVFPDIWTHILHNGRQMMPLTCLPRHAENANRLLPGRTAPVNILFPCEDMSADAVCCAVHVVYITRTVLGSHQRGILGYHCNAKLYIKSWKECISPKPICCCNRRKLTRSERSNQNLIDPDDAGDACWHGFLQWFLYVRLSFCAICSCQSTAWPKIIYSAFVN
nr:hypothetical protein CFP56_13444 [Quercus suber]